MRGLTQSRTRLVILLAAIALFLASSANIAQTLQAHRNCKNIELIKTNTRSVLVASYHDMINGKNDDAFRTLYGADWPVKKAEAILKAEENIQKFDPSNCPWFIH